MIGLHTRTGSREHFTLNVHGVLNGAKMTVYTKIKVYNMIFIYLHCLYTIINFGLYHNSDFCSSLYTIYVMVSRTGIAQFKETDDMIFEISVS